jgi:hypothetical protein
MPKTFLYVKDFFSATMDFVVLNLPIAPRMSGCVSNCLTRKVKRASNSWRDVMRHAESCVNSSPVEAARVGQTAAAS